MIRVADAADLSALTPLIERYWEFERIKGFDTSRITTLLTELFRVPDQGQIWIAEEGDQSVGYLLAVYLFSLEHAGLMAEIDEFFIVPEKRSLKIGTDLLDAATTAIARRGITHIQLQLGMHNRRGQSFYQRHGFEPLSEYRLFHRSLLP